DFEVTNKLTSNIITSSQITVDDLTVNQGLEVLGVLTADEIRTNVLGAKSITIEVSEDDEENASIGTGVIKAGETQITIHTNMITENSRIFVTPTVRTDKQLSVVEKKDKEYFIVEINSTEDHDITFDWWIIN
ncbi:unnamed protein product, partial [marine sediment metagenome]